MTIPLIPSTLVARMFHKLVWGAYAPRRNLAPLTFTTLSVPLKSIPSARRRLQHAGARVLPETCRTPMLAFIASCVLSLVHAVEVNHSEPNLVRAEDIAGEPRSTPQERLPAGPVEHAFEVSSEALWAGGIGLTESAFAYRQTRPKSELSLSLAHSSIDLEYQPADFDLISQSADLAEHRFAIQGGLKQKVAPTLSLLAGAGVYDGYSNYRTLWLNEYYRQYFSGVPGYITQDPEGYNLSGGVRWEYQPAASFLQIEGFYSRDDVPSAYEVLVLQAPQIGTELFRTTDRLHTAGVRISVENVLTRRIRVLNEIQIADTTDRDPRFSYQGSVNWALAERWVLRSVAGFSKEEPRFHSFTFASTLEYEWDQRWFVSVFGRYYKDNGEIDNPLLLSVAAPALETVQAGVGLRWQGGRWSFRIVAGPYFTRYASVESDVKPFEKLYRDRDWGSAQAALSFAF